VVNGDIRAELVRKTTEFWSGTRAPGLAVVVRQNGEELFSAYLGIADAIRRIPVTSATRFGVGSITKQFTAAAVLLLQDAGALDIEEPISTYLADLAGLTDPPSLRQLLGHTGGLRSALEGAMIAGCFQGTTSLAAVIAEMSQRSDHVPPGTRWEYSNTGYFLLGHVIEKASGMRLRAYLTRHLLERAGLPSMFRGQSPDRSHEAIGYTLEPGGFASVAAADPQVAFGSGDLFSSASSIAAWQEVLWGNTLLSESARDQMRRGGQLVDGSSTQYGLGAYVVHQNGRTELSHDGNSAGYSGQVAWYPESRLSVAVLMNCQSHVAEALEKRLSACILGDGLEREVALDAGDAQLQGYVGVYRYGVHEVKVEASSDGLVVSTPTGRRAVLSPTGHHSFAEVADPSMRYLFLVESGLVKGFSIARFGKSLGIAERIEIS
jgi:CubicO group peptidase (beta-lactamase class C family)